MALSALIQFEVQTGGSDNNGGGFKAGASGTDRSLVITPFATLSAASVVNADTTKIDVAVGDYTPVAADVGNVYQNTGGTATAGFYEITASGGGQWTLDRAVGTAGQTCIGAMGGCLATPGQACGAANVALQKIHWKSGTYNMTTTTANVSGGRLAQTGGVIIEGYGASREDLGTPPVLNADLQTTFTMVTLTGGTTDNQCPLVNVELDGNNKTSVIGVADGASYILPIYKVLVRNCTTGHSTLKSAVLCTTISCTTGFSFAGTSSRAYGCFAKGGTTGFLAAAGGVLSNCVASGCSGIGFNLGYMVSCFNCNTYGCGSDGFNSVNYPLASFVNCIAANNSGYGFNVGTTVQNQLVNCAYYNNTSGNVRTVQQREIAGITLTGLPWTNAAGDDFSLNTTANQGAACRAAGIPGVLLGASTTGYLDRGAVQHQDPAGGGGLLTQTGMSGGIRG